MAVPQIVNRYPGKKIQIFVAIHIPEPAAFALGCHNGEASISGGDA
jgi:hypothetical protein